MGKDFDSGDVFTIHQLELLGQNLAKKHKKCRHGGPNALIPRLKQNEDVLRDTYKLITASLVDGYRSSPASNWFLDNYHVIEEQIRTSRLHLSRKFSAELPLVDNSNYESQPRVYALAKDLIIHTDGLLNIEAVTCIIDSYQRVEPLRLGELWAFPIMLRLGLIDNLRSIAESITTSYIDQRNATFWAERMARISRSEPQNLITEVSAFAKSEPRLSCDFVSEFTRRIQMHCHSPSLPLSWIEQYLETKGLSIEQHHYQASQEHAHDHMSICNSITSLRFLGDTDWRKVVERMSYLDAILKKDPAGTYSNMDFLTRDSYRHVVESISRYSEYNELEVAEKALAMAEAKPTDLSFTTDHSHIGDFLIGTKRHQFEKMLHMKRTLIDSCRKLILTFPLGYYLGTLAAVTAIIVLPFLSILSAISLPISIVLIVAMIALIPASQAALALANWFTVLILKPKPWPRMDFTSGVPDFSRTIVAIPSMLNNPKSIEKLANDLEIRYLGNRDKNIIFALLTDFSDSSTQSETDDPILLDIAVNAIRELNRKYLKIDSRAPFYLFHRSRTWNSAENVWMGHERKRGKLLDINAYLRGKNKDSFSTVIGQIENLGDIRYVITLDADSVLPRETAVQLISTMAHPLNRPIIDMKSRTIKNGYGILQPRVTIHLKNVAASRFTRLFSDEFGIDPYTKSVSDVYQDLFHEGSFIGKGIYDIDAFQTTLEFRFPDNRILSHDLIESGFARSGLVSDIQLIEEYPANYSSDATRKHRWVRGDWQIATWILSRVPTKHSYREKNQLSGLIRWKILDNLRRSLNPIATLGLFLFSWSITDQSSSFLTMWLIVYISLPHFLHTSTIRIWRSPSISIHQARREQARLIFRALFVSCLNVIFMPYEAFISADAALRSLYRLAISKKKLLQWQPTATDGTASSINPFAYSKLMWFAPVAALVGSVLVLDRTGYDGVMMLPLSVGWLLSPFIAWWISQPLKHKPVTLSDSQRQFLNTLSRRTWFFFETHMTADDHWLPPDNIQEYPTEVVAHRTSPTNIGLALLSVLGAFDSGYLSLNTLAKRLEDTIETLENMERFNGHFYNWYDTQTLKPLDPLYISTVDSGNLAGTLLVLRQGLNELAAGPLHSNEIFNGLNDTFLVLRNLAASFDSTSILLRSKIDGGLDLIRQFLERDVNSYQYSIEEISDSLKVVKNITQEMESNIIKIQNADTKEWVSLLSSQIEDHQNYLEFLSKKDTTVLRSKLGDLSRRVSTIMKQEYGFLYNKEKNLLAIGYHVADNSLDKSYYDLLASEARLASFLAIANGSLPQEHWFALGRQLTLLEGGKSILLSWSGSMFEYLMPLLILPTYEGTLLDQSCRQCILSQIRYGKDQKVPWGISESGYNVTDASYNYQYRAFGVPGLGFKRGLNQDLVIAPYASAMALMLEPLAACQNLEDMETLGCAGRFGFYEAIDFTPTRIPVGEKFAIIKSFMAHHQGMTFLSLVRYLKKEPMQRRLEHEPIFKATELLLHERIPKASVNFPDIFVGFDVASPPASKEESFRFIKDPCGRLPDAHLLGNGRYHVMITSAGSGFSTWNNLMLTRWQEDQTRDNNGFFTYIKDIDNSNSWSVGYQPLLRKGNDYEVIFSEGRAEIRRTDNEIGTHLEVAVSPDDDTELRRVTITNHSSKRRTIDFTTYAEVVLAPIGDDQSHPVFSKLFVETEILADQSGILCRRRPRDASQKNPWLYHAVFVHGGKTRDLGFETDREKFIGRNQDLTAPFALSHPLTNSTGSVLDPIISFRKRISIAPGKHVTVDCILGISEQHQDAIELVNRYHERHIADRVLELSWTHGHVLLQQLNCSTTDAILFGKMTGPLIYGGSNLRGDGAAIKANLKSQSALWSYGISGDLPIIILRLHGHGDLKLLQKIIKAHDYWRRKGLAVDLFIWNESFVSYRQELHDRIMEAIVMASSAALIDKRGGIFIRRSDQMADEDLVMFHTVARLILSDEVATLEDQLTLEDIDMSNLPRSFTPRLLNRKSTLFSQETEVTSTSADELLFDNGIGGFNSTGREYIIQVGEGKSTPLPWSNVLANRDFGTLVTESGSSYTWSENSHEHRLTPWFNDPVSDPSGESIYIRDEQSGEYWSPTPGPSPGTKPYTICHGFGYSTYTTKHEDISSAITIFVPKEAPLKISSLKLTNNSDKQRRLSITSYFELVLGEMRSKTAPYIITEWDATLGLMLARNTFAGEFKGRNVFLSATEPVNSVSGSRSEFLGRNGTLANPAAMKRIGHSNRVGASLDPCMAMQIFCNLEPGESKEVAFVFGCTTSPVEARQLARQFRSHLQIHLALTKVHQNWSALLGKLQIESSVDSINILANGWLMYQTITSRIWGRTGFYQSGGAYGFRDQLQDVMAVVYSSPEMARELIIRCAGRQFIEGDVQHWWHPPLGKGVRTTISDDYLWLPYVTAHYVKVTGDTTILEETAPYLFAKLLTEGQESEYGLPTTSDQIGSIYDHCTRAIQNSGKRGTHGLPLMGSGDWNDGMNQVGIRGKGESVWLGFFLRSTLKKFSFLAELMNDRKMLTYCSEQQQALKNSMDQNAWDGDWYLRAFFDDGTPLGSSRNEECRIDSLPQSWSVFVGDIDDRAKKAMVAVNQNLVDEKTGIIRLFTPPFDHQVPNPGYIRGYLPGIRENGGQYTHAALWVVRAFAELGEVDQAWKLLNLINPIHHSDTEGKMNRYKVEPYALAADIYSEDAQIGRGGWTWYTGSAAWFYTTILETFLGFDLSGNKLSMTPRLPTSLQGFNLAFTHHKTFYKIEVQRTGASKIILDDIVVIEPVSLTDDGGKHTIRVELV